MKKNALLLLLSVLCCTLAAQSQRPVAITAHRGFWKCESAGKAQNSVAALRMAQDFGCWGSELDVHLSADGIVVVNHDRHRGGKDIQTTDYKDLRRETLSNGEPLPTLAEYLAQAVISDRTVLVLELKSQYSEERENLLIDKCIEGLKMYNLYDPSRVIFISFSHFICRRLAELAPQFTNQYLSGNIAPEDLHREGINGIDYHFSVFDKHPEWVREAQDLGMSVNAWTVDKDEDILRMAELGVDCITTNVPDRVRELLGAREFRILP